MLLSQPLANDSIKAELLEVILSLVGPRQLTTPFATLELVSRAQYTPTRPQVLMGMRCDVACASATAGEIAGVRAPANAVGVRGAPVARRPETLLLTRSRSHMAYGACSYSRSKNVRVRSAATSLLCAAVLESSPEQAVEVQTSARDWGVSHPCPHPLAPPPLTPTTVCVSALEPHRDCCGTSSSVWTLI